MLQAIIAWVDLSIKGLAHFFPSWSLGPPPPTKKKKINKKNKNKK
jgi:hypothetical protein